MPYGLSQKKSFIHVTDARVIDWLPGDIVCDDSFFIPSDLPEGIYDVQVAIVDRVKHEPRVNLANEGKQGDGWYQIGKISITK
ncbi:MAG: hypothetical protein IPJ37_24475 [Bacteroidales bacterium]|nr:hypothetical protein [Bacteroidales bacterium]